MKLSTPPRILWNVRGSVSESKQKKLQHEAQRQIGLLTHAMAFRGLIQGRRSRTVGGFKFRCVSVFGLESVAISLVGEEGEKKKALKLEECWCLCQFTQGVVSRIIDASTVPGACIAATSCGTYPDCALDDITVYDGDRYVVNACQSSTATGGRSIEYICVPTDFEEYEVADTVILAYIDNWPEDGEWESCGTEGKTACSVLGRDKSADVVVEALDGQFVIMPYEVE